MKHLITLILLTASLSGVGQEIKTLEYPPKRIDSRTGIAAEGDTSSAGYTFSYDRYTVSHRTPDTVHAILLVTTSTTRSSIARTVKGYVVKGEQPVYLDCEKREIKLPVIVWGWREEFKRLR